MAEIVQHEEFNVDHYMQSPSKKRKITPPRDTFPDNSDTSLASFSNGFPSKEDSVQAFGTAHDLCQDDHETISIPASSRQAGQTVAPFLAKHIPDQYAPGGGLDALGNTKMKDPNTKYCYRHRPDLKCRRQVNEPSMDQLQHELENLSFPDQQAIAHVWSVFSAAPAKHRNLMLQGILTQCCFPQLSYLSASVRELIRIDFLTALPPEISYKVLCFLDTASLCKAAQVSRKWRSLADDDVVWHKMCEQHIAKKCEKCGWGLPLLERKRLRASKRQIQLRATGRGLNEWSPNITPYPEASSSSEKSSHDGTSSTLLTVHSSDDEGVAREAPKLMESSSRDEFLTPADAEAVKSYFQPRTRPWKDVYKDRFQVGINWKHGRCSIQTFKGHTVCFFNMLFS